MSSAGDLFTLEREDGWRPPSLRSPGLRLAASGGGLVALATSTDALICWPTDDPTGAPELVEFPKGSRPDGSRIHSVFVDPTGSLCVTCVASSGSGQTFAVAPSAAAAAAALPVGVRPRATENRRRVGLRLRCDGSQADAHAHFRIRHARG